MTPGQAKEEYRNCWNAFRRTESEPERRALGAEMDRLQPLIPGSYWREFTATLPGYTEFWREFAIRSLTILGGAGVMSQ
jgi:hypothetical protein